MTPKQFGGGIGSGVEGRSPDMRSFYRLRVEVNKPMLRRDDSTVARGLNVAVPNASIGKSTTLRIHRGDAENFKMPGSNPGGGHALVSGERPRSKVGQTIVFCRLSSSDAMAGRCFFDPVRPTKRSGVDRRRKPIVCPTGRARRPVPYRPSIASIASMFFNACSSGTGTSAFS